MLAEKLGRPFIDTDDLIVKSSGLPLQDIINTEGPMGFRKREERVLLDIHVQNHIIATGGSSVYSAPGMKHLARDGVIILLQVELPLLLQRVGDTSGRGLVRDPSQSFEHLHAERMPLYRLFADMIVECGRNTRDEVCSILLDRLNKGPFPAFP